MYILCTLTEVRGDVENLLFFHSTWPKIEGWGAMIFFFQDKRVTLYEHFSFASNLVTYYFWIKYILNVHITVGIQKKDQF